jgi:adenylate cyclase
LNTAEGNLRARAVWQERLDRFPNSALLRNKIAWTYLWPTESGSAPIDQQDISRAWTLVQESQAVHIKPRLVAWLNHFIMCPLYAWHDGDFRRSIVEAEAAQTMAPYDAHSRGILSFYLANAGDLDRALAWGQWASTHDLRPNPVYRANIAWAYYLAGRPQEALAAFGDAVHEFPVQYMALLARLGQQEEARAELARGQSMFRDTIANERLWPLRPELEEGYLNDLRAAGMPET